MRIYVSNRVPREMYARAPVFNGMAPMEVRRTRTAAAASLPASGDGVKAGWAPHMRRFGCLAYIMAQPREEVPKLQARWRKAVFLGYSKNNSAWLFGTYAKDARCASGIRWAEYETRDAKFLEDCLVSDAESLQPDKGGVLVSDEKLLQLASAPMSRHETASASHEGGSDGSDGGEMTTIRDGDVVRVYRKRPRGRPKGSKDTAPRKRRGATAGRDSAGDAASGLLSDGAGCFYAGDGREGDTFDEGEVVVEATVQLSVSEAIASSDAPLWIEAMGREKAKLEAASTWRDLTDEEVGKAKKVLPVAILLSRKRDHSFKARACVLGNLVRKDGLNVYAPVVTMTGHRYLLFSAAADGDYVQVFDIDCAFLNAELPHEVYIKLPKVWQEENAPTVKRLLKALYGLPQSPRAWFQRYELHLREHGWCQCDFEPGLWRRRSKAFPSSWLKLSVYVDDNFLGGPDEEETRQAPNEALEKFPGRPIEPEDVGGGWLRWDALGADLSYNRRRREMTLSMESFLQKLAAVHELGNFRRTSSPNFTEEDLERGEQESVDFPFRELAGSLQWACTIARPDVARQVNLLAQHVERTTTSTKVGCALRVLRYLLTTSREGPSYSPDAEQRFQSMYSKWIGSWAGRAFPKLHLFSDASFASCSSTFKSVSGSVLFYRSTPILWKSARQTVRAYSTTESEWIAAPDSIALVCGLGFLEFYDPPARGGDGAGVCSQGVLPTSLVLWVDNKSAVVVAGSNEVRPKCRHFALRYHRVRDESGKIRFCPSSMQRADALTKCTSMGQRRLLLHHDSQ